MLAGYQLLHSENEQFLDFVQHTSAKRPIAANADDVAKDIYCMELAQEAVDFAKNSCYAQNVPFVPPDEFSAEKFRPESIMSRVTRIEDKRHEEAEIQQKMRRRRIERIHQLELQHNKRLNKHQQVKQRKEVIEIWKKERELQQKSGVADDKLLTMEQAEKAYDKKQQSKKRNKIVKYGVGTKAQHIRNRVHKGKVRAGKKWSLTY